MHGIESPNKVPGEYRQEEFCSTRPAVGGGIMKPEVQGILYMIGMVAIMVATSIWVASISQIH